VDEYADWENALLLKLGLGGNGAGSNVAVG